MEINFIAEALKFLVLGMSTVFSFLVLLVFILKIQAKVLTQYFSPPKQTPVSNSQVLLKSDNLAMIAAIVASLKHKK